jgi:hypothetical protein
MEFLDFPPGRLGGFSSAGGLPPVLWQAAFTGAPFGSSGTMTAARVITQAVQSVPVKRTGYSGLMVPVLEDSVLARRWTVHIGEFE